MQAEIQNQNSRLENFERDGFQTIESFIHPNACDSLSGELTRLFEEQQKSVKNKIGGLRNLLQNPCVLQFAKQPKLISILEEAAASSVFPVRATFFDKTAASNWRVPWHQDLTITVADQIETEGFGPWSVKDDVIHVQPPAQILENMVTVRLHLDDCLADNGALKVIPSSHTLGKLVSPQITGIVKKQNAVTCELSKGGLLLMRPLLLHSSSPAQNPAHRRVLHIEYSATELPGNLRWFYS
jgi:ectoine hydroxylase-related dioxygenase (phytanoyl-CoA dioxygenase family)